LATGGYTTRDVAKLLDIPVPKIRAFLAAGFLKPEVGPRGEHRFTLQDIVLLKTAKGLSETVPAAKLRRALMKLRDELPSGRPLSAVRITAEGADVVVHDGTTAWVPESGQRLLDFGVAELAEKVAPLARRAVEAARSADDWFHAACDLEPVDAPRARQAYEKALQLSPTHSDALVNLGRLLHEEGDAGGAEQLYRRALDLRPADATAAFNLGVALADLGRVDESIVAYERALALDPGLADAHFNLSRLYEKTGRKSSAIGHLKSYKKLIETSGPKVT